MDGLLKYNSDNNKNGPERSVEEQLWPLITIGIPTYNGAHKIERAVDSIFNQNYPNLEIFISDNFSNDDTFKVCMKLLLKHKEIRYHRHNQNIGMLPNFEYLLKNASGEYFMWLADDDVLAPEVLDKYVDFMQNNLDFTLVSGRIEYWLNGEVVEYEKNLNFESQSPFKRVISYYYKVVHGALYHGFMRTSMAKRIEIRKVIGNDWHFVANAAFLGKIKNLNTVGYRKAFGGSSDTFEKYALLIGETPLAGKYPHFKIAVDAYKEIMKQSDIYDKIPLLNRWILAVSSFTAVATSYFFKIHLLIVAGKIKRFLYGSITSDTKKHYDLVK